MPTIPLFSYPCWGVLFSLVLLPVALAQGRPDTLRLGLDAAIRQALVVSPEVGAVAARQAFAEARWQQARASRFFTEFDATSANAPAPGIDNPNGTPDQSLYLDPEVRNDWSALRPFSRLDVRLTQPLLTWGELGGNLGAARSGIAVEEASVEAKALEVAFRTGELYFNVLLTDALFRLTEEAGEIVQQAKREIRRLLDEGAQDVDDADLYQVLITEQEFNRRVVEVTQRRATARVALARQLFLSDTVAVVPADEELVPLALPPDTLSTWFTLARVHRPELAQADAGLAARTSLVEVARSDFYPKVFLSASSTWSAVAGRVDPRNPYISDPFRSRGLRAGIGVRQKLNIPQTRARVAQARAERDQVVYQKQGVEQLILFEVEEAWRSLLIAQAALDTRNEALRLSKEWLRTEQINFDLELGDTENLVRAVQANLELQAATHEAVRAYNVAVLKLLRTSGVLARRAKSGILLEP